MTIRKARHKADRPAKHRPEGFARKVPSCGVALLVEQNERSTFVARLASEHFSRKRGSQRVLHQPASTCGELPAASPPADLTAVFPLGVPPRQPITATTKSPSSLRVEAAHQAGRVERNGGPVVYDM